MASRLENGKPLCDDSFVTRHPTRNFRPEPGEYQPAKAHIEAHGYSMNTLLRAALRWFNANPTAALAALLPHLNAVAEKTPPRGRPRSASRD